MRSNTVAALLRAGEEQLETNGIPDAAFDARCLLAHALGYTLSELHLYSTDPVDTAVQANYAAFLSRRTSGEPLQYILGEWDFYDLSFTVRAGVLIPRPETEFLARQAIRLLPPGGVLYDVCAGTGCIGLSAAKHRPDIQVFLFEKYADAYSVLQDNLHRHSLANAHAVQRDMFLGATDGLPAPDGIVSNPPYIETAVLSSLQREVQHEPRSALDGGADGLRFYRALREKWFPLLRPNGFLSMECGEEQPPHLIKMFSAPSRIDPDFAGTDRFVTIWNSSERQEPYAS